MLKIKHLTAIWIILIIPPALVAQNKNLKADAEVQAFVPKGFEILDVAKGDLNGDKRPDKILVLRDPAEANDTKQDYDNPFPRPLLILIRNEAGKLELAKQNNQAIMCSFCGGMMGDPYQNIAIKNNEFTILHYGGSRDRWEKEHTYRYNTQSQTWELVNIKETNTDNLNPKYSNVVITPTEELGGLTIDSLAKIHNIPDAVGGVVTGEKVYFYQSPNLKTIKKAFLLKGDKIDVYNQTTNFVYAAFTNTKGQSTEGYLKKTDVQVLSKK